MPKRAVRNFAPPSPAIAEAVSGSRWSYQVENIAGKNPAIYIRGVIGLSTAYNEYGGDYAGTFRELEAEITALGDVPEIDLYIFSPGGYIWPAIALYNLIQRHPARFNGIVDGLAASSAAVLLMACDVIQVPRNAQVMIHNATSWADGDYRAMEQTAKLLRRENRNIADIFAERIASATGRTDTPAILDEVLQMMEEETYLTGAECLALGLADEVAAEIDLPAVANRNRRELGSLNLASLPDAVRALFDSPAITQNSPANLTPTTAMPDPVTPPATPAAPANVAPANVVAADPAAPVTPPATVADPANVAPAAPAPSATPDLATLIANAVTEGNKPLQDQVTALAGEVENLKNLRATGAPANAFGNQPPVPAPLNSAGTATVIDFDKATPGQLVELGRKNLLAKQREARQSA